MLWGCCRSDHQLNTYDWLADVVNDPDKTDLVEVQFKNTRKGYYHNVNNLQLTKGDMVAVEASPGHDIWRGYAYGKARGFADKEGQLEVGRRHQTHLSLGQTRRPRQVRRG